MRVSKRIKGILRTNQRQNWRKTRIKMQRGLCHYCGQKMTEPTLDHVVPLSKGGSDSFDNTVAACLECNKSKGDTI